MRTRSALWAVAILSFALMGNWLPVSADMVQPVGSLAKIGEAERNGTLDWETSIMYRVFAVVAPERLPLEYRADEGARERCGTLAIRDALAAEPALSSENQEILGQLLRARPYNQTAENTTHYRVHFDTSGSEMILGWPDRTYLDAVKASVESSYYVEHTILEFDIPPSDGGLGGGSGLIDCYVQEVGPGIYGYAQAEGPGDGPEPRDFYGFFVIDNDYAGFGYADPADPARVTIAHEYNHVIQYGYDYLEGGWAMESCAAWGHRL